MATMIRRTAVSLKLLTKMKASESCTTIPLKPTLYFFFFFLLEQITTESIWAVTLAV